MSDDFRFVHREETFTDLAVRELAKSRSACICRIQFGRCTKEECKHCSVNRQFARCYNELSDYDKQRVHSYAAEKWVEDSRDPWQWCSFPKLVASFTGLMLAILGGLAVMVFMFNILANLPGDKPPVYSDTDVYIIEAMKKSHANISDLNNDGLVNCIDYACSFKLAWDRLFPKYKGWCKIVRNYNPTNGFNHLFIKVSGIDGTVFVEAWAKNINKYTMYENWPNGRYNPEYNFYGETWLWMSKVRVN